MRKYEVVISDGPRKTVEAKGFKGCPWIGRTQCRRLQVA